MRVISVQLRVSALACSLCLIPSLRADTLTLRDNAEINGRIRYAEGTFFVMARYRGSSRTLKFDRSEVLTLEFNDRDFNSSAPPKDLSVFSARTSGIQNASNGTNHAQKIRGKGEREGLASQKHSPLSEDEFNPSVEDVIWFRNKSKVVGRLEKIENNRITFQDEKGNPKGLDAAKISTVLIAPN